MNSRPLFLLFSVILNDPLFLLFFCHSECSDSETKNLAEAANFVCFLRAAPFRHVERSRNIQPLGALDTICGVPP